MFGSWVLPRPARSLQHSPTLPDWIKGRWGRAGKEGKIKGREEDAIPSFHIFWLCPYLVPPLG